MREKFHGVPMLPFGILAGFAEEREIRLTDLAEEGFRFRTAEKTEEPGKFRLCFYNSLAGGYREMELTDFEMEEEEHTSFFYICGLYRVRNLSKRGAPPHRAVQPLHPSEAYGR